MREAMDKYETGYVSYSELYETRWCEKPRILAHYERLDAEQKNEVLGFVALTLHELTHHIDFLTTPFGVNFHAKTCREYINFQAFSQFLLADHKLVPAGFLAYFEDYLIQGGMALPETASRSWEHLRGQVLTFEAWGDGGMVRPRKKRIQPGWGENRNPVQLLGNALHKVTVNGFFLTVGIPHHLDWYLRPLTLFETRAIANSVLWILYLLDQKGSAVEDVRSFLRAFYPKETCPPDYWLIFDLLANLWGYAGFDELLAGGSCNALRQVLMLASGASWYALHAPPPMGPDSGLTSNPVVRLLCFLQSLNAAAKQKLKFESLVAFADQIDGSDLGRQYDCPRVSEILSFCISFLSHHTSMNKTAVRDTELQRHFARIFKIQFDQMKKRITDGYASILSMPEHGNPYFALETDKEADQLLFEYKPSARVEGWFAFRQNLLYKNMDCAKVILGLNEYCCS